MSKDINPLILKYFVASKNDLAKLSPQGRAKLISLQDELQHIRIRQGKSPYKLHIVVSESMACFDKVKELLTTELQQKGVIPKEDSDGKA